MTDYFTILPESLKIEIYCFDITYRIIFGKVLRELLRKRFVRNDMRYPSFIFL